MSDGNRADQSAGLREHDLRELPPCALCGKQIGHTGLPLFWRVTVERFGVDLRAIQRQDGLGALLGSSLLAAVMGPDEIVAKPLMEPVKAIVCEECALKPAPIALLAEKQT